MKTWAQISKQLQAFLHRLSENTKTAIIVCKYKKKKIIEKLINNFFFNNSGRALDNRAGRKTVRAGRSALRNMPSWNTGTDCDDLCLFAAVGYPKEGMHLHLQGEPFARRRRYIDLCVKG